MKSQRSCVACKSQDSCLAPGRCGNGFKSVISKHMLWITFTSSSCEIALRWMPENAFYVKSTVAQVMAWCHQATSHYLSLWWYRLVLLCVITKPQCVKTSLPQIPKNAIMGLDYLGPDLINVKMPSYQYRKSHYRDKAFMRLSFISTMGFPILVKWYLKLNESPVFFCVPYAVGLRH